LKNAFQPNLASEAICYYLSLAKTNWQRILPTLIGLSATVDSWIACGGLLLKRRNGWSEYHCCTIFSQ
jgi:hypothetical protein